MKKISEDFAYDQKCFPIGMKLLNIFANSLHTKKVWFNLSTIKSIEKNLGSKTEICYDLHI